MPNISNKLVWGVGTKGNGVSRVNGKLTKAYQVWASMLKRCYDQKSLSKYPTYVGCSVSSEWLFFPTFKEWFDNNYVEGYELDKDLLVAGNKEYGPETCLFVPHSLNLLFNDHGRARGDYLIGVCFDKQRGNFTAYLKINGTSKNLGRFNNADEAHQAYLIAKKANIIRMANEWKDKIPIKLYDALIKTAVEC